MKDERLSRRGFIGAAGIAAGAAVLAACGGAPTEEVPTSFPPTEVPKPTVTLRPTESPKPSPTATEIPYQLEDGTQMERVEQGQLVDLFPGSEVYMSERGDAVIINEETGLRLAGQVVENKYGSFTFLFGDTLYQYAYTGNVRETADINAGGYPNFADSNLKDEIGRIISTLIQLKNKEINVGSVDLATYEPKPKDYVAIYTNPGTIIMLQQSMPEGLIKEEDYKRHEGTLGFPILKGPNGEELIIKPEQWSVFEEGYDELTGGPDQNLRRAICYDSIRRSMMAIGLVDDALKAQGLSRWSLSWTDLYAGPFGELFTANQEMADGLAVFDPDYRFNKGFFDKTFTYDEYVREVRKVMFLDCQVVEADFGKFK